MLQPEGHETMSAFRRLRSSRSCSRELGPNGDIRSDHRRMPVACHFLLAARSQGARLLASGRRGLRELLQAYGITATNFAALQYGSIDSNVSFVVLGCRAQDTHVLREISLRERCHNAPGTWASDTQANGITDCKDLPDPSILYETLLARADEVIE